MDTIKTFFLLCLGYGVIVLVLAGLASAGYFDSSPSLTEALIMIVPAFFYPPAAFSYLFYVQSGQKPWFHITWISLAIGFCVVFGINAAIGQANDPYAGLAYFALGLTIAIPLSILIIATASVQKIQRPITRALGLCVFIGLSASAAINAYGYQFLLDFDLFSPQSLIAIGVTVVTSLSALLIATFKGVGEEKQKSAD